MNPLIKKCLIRVALFLAYGVLGGWLFSSIIEKRDETYATTANRLLEKLRKTMAAKYNLTNSTEFYEFVEAASKATQTRSYGSITPVTQLGQIMTVIYGVFGIPLTLLAMRAMAFQFNEQIESVLVGIEIKCLKRNQVKDKEFKIVFFNIFLTLLYMFLSALMTSTSDENYSYPQAVYVWFITMTTVGFGDFVPRESNPYTILVGLCFMSGTIDAMVTYYESEQGEKSIARLTDNCLCCRRREPSVQVDVNDDQIEFSETKDVATQTSEIMNFGVQNSAF
ncbi:hypothetical protein QZH41_017340 [Actinostola sp. cb2023]|nr:hypothetical protein QZH41_017340 [Actinostola sp. cb2023]